jgi:Isochorismatase family
VGQRAPIQGTRLDMLLRNGNIHDVVVAGAFTRMVVESTVRQGFDLGLSNDGSRGCLLRAGAGGAEHGVDDRHSEFCSHR